jgi:putative Ca2+/H+ antiporter (TMEM165/GDT1 family)
VVVSGRQWTSTTPASRAANFSSRDVPSDKTQIIALALAAKYDALVAVVTGTTLGMMIVNIPTVLFAERATKWVPVKVVRIVAALIYAILGVITLLGYSHLSL